MVIKTKSGKTQSVPAETPSEKLARLAREQGVADTATFEHLYGIGRQLWADDNEFEAFLERVQSIRREKD
jgi:hypothetical protein